MNRIETCFENLRAQKKKALITYITAGHPRFSFTLKCLKALDEAGVDIVELGVPFSDPVADGPVIQKASEVALHAGTTLEQILKGVKGLRTKKFSKPVVLFSYFNPIFKYGVEKFLKKAASSGIDGVLIVDLPPEEGEEWSAKLKSIGLCPIFLASPTTVDERLQVIGNISSGFVYYISRTGVTGAQKKISQTLSSEVARARKQIDLPLAIGFGVSSPSQAKSISQLGDAVVVGSALVSLIEESKSETEALKKVSKFARDLARAVHKE